MHIQTQGASRAELMEKYQTVGADAMTPAERQRLKRLLGLEEIRANNAAQVAQR